MPELARAADESQDPILRINTDMHTTAINRISIDRDGHYLLTASDDKTMKLWSLRGGELLQTYRPMIGNNHEGKLFAGAISPDARWVAGAGWTQGDGSGASKHNVYLFKRANGEQSRRLSGADSAVYQLCFSPDGKYLAAMLSGRNGVRVWSMDSFEEVMRDTEYGSSGYGCAFGQGGQLVTSSLDGYVRLYDPSLELSYITAFSGNKRPYAVTFSPDDERIAVGFIDATQVSVLDAQDLSLIYQPDTSGIANGNLSNVAWSADGTQLWAGGMFDNGDGSPVVSWTAGGRGSRTLLSAGQQTIQDIKPHPDGGLVVGTSRPAWMQISSAGETVHAVEPVIGNFRDKLGNAFLLSEDASKVSFGLESGSRQQVTFDLIQQTLTDGILNADMRPAVIKTRGLRVKKWQNSNAPKVGRKTLALDVNETSRSLAIAPNHESFVLGTEWHLRRYDKKGNQIWQIDTPGITSGVNISSDGHLVVAAHTDGTLRWYRLDDGEELLAMFLNVKDRNWVIWSPSGYFNASAGGSQMIGWHINRGIDRKADFYPVAQLRERFYRPDIIERIFATLSPDEANQLAATAPHTNIKQLVPPTVTLLGPLSGSNFDSPTVTFHYRVDSPNDNPISGIRILLDGRPLQTSRGLQVNHIGTDKLEITLPKRNVRVSIIAESSNGASTPANTELVWSGESEPAPTQPRLFVLSVGVSDYADDRLDLGLAEKDARDFAAVVQQQSGTIYSEVISKTLSNPTRDELLDNLEILENAVTTKDVTMLFLAGHGVNDPDGYYFYLTSDTDTARLRRTAVEYHDIKQTLSSLPGKTLAFIDTCHSGNIMGGRRGVANITGVINDLSAAENGVVVFASSTGKQYSLEDPSWGNGAFTKALVEGLSGAADYTGDGKITINQLDLYLSERVKQLTNNLQTPTTTKPQTIADFPIAITTARQI
jgi:WD40 repeat protein